MHWTHYNESLYVHNLDDKKHTFHELLQFTKNGNCDKVKWE